MTKIKNELEIQKPNYYAIIPSNVRYDKDLKANEKLLYSEISALCNTYGYCVASNTYFSELYGVDKNTISKWINNLKNKKYIKVDIIENYQRKIYLTFNNNKIIKKQTNQETKKNLLKIKEILDNKNKSNY